MNVHLTSELEKLVQAKVASGLYNNQSEVVREGLRLLFQQDQVREARLTYLKASIAEGLAQAERGEIFDGETVMEELCRELDLD